MQKFSVLFSVDTSINRKNISYFLSFNFYFISTKKSIIITLINAGLLPTFDVVEIHLTSQYSLSVDAKITSSFYPIRASVMPLLNDFKGASFIGEVSGDRLGPKRVQGSAQYRAPREIFPEALGN